MDRDKLSPEVISPQPRSRPLWVGAILILTGLGALTSATLAAAIGPGIDSDHVEPCVHYCTHEFPSHADETKPTAISPPPAVTDSRPHREHAIAFSAGGNAYIQLNGTSSNMPGHGAARYVPEDYAEDVGTAIAPVTGGVDESLTAWIGKSVIVDGTCEAKVVALELVTRGSGSFDYMGVELNENSSDDTKATALLKNGHVVLAGRLDGCTVNLGYARAAELAKSLNGIEINSKPLVEKAQNTLQRSAMVKAKQKALLENDDVSEEESFAEFSSHVFRHPQTGTTIVSVHMMSWLGCGYDGINVWGLYEVVDGSQLDELSLIELTDTVHIDHAVDIDADGTFEFMGREILSGRRLIDSTGEVLNTLVEPFYGCPC
jgi:hypothetical protein